MEQAAVIMTRDGLRDDLPRANQILGGLVGDGALASAIDLISEREALVAKIAEMSGELKSDGVES